MFTPSAATIVRFDGHPLDTTHDYLVKHTSQTVPARVEKVKHLLQNPDTTVTEAAYAAGFQSLSQFYRVFGRITGEPPRRFRERLHSAAPKTAPRRRKNPPAAAAGA